MDYLRCDGTLTVDAFGVPTCDQWTVISQDELLSLAPVTQLVELLNALVVTPSQGEIAAAFFAAFSLPLIFFLSAWGLQQVVGFFNSQKSDED